VCPHACARSADKQQYNPKFINLFVSVVSFTATNVLMPQISESPPHALRRLRAHRRPRPRRSLRAREAFASGASHGFPHAAAPPPLCADVAKVYAAGDPNAQLFVRHMSLFVSNFLRVHLPLLENTSDVTRQALVTSLGFLLRFSEVTTGWLRLARRGPVAADSGAVAGPGRDGVQDLPGALELHRVGSVPHHAAAPPHAAGALRAPFCAAAAQY
jgi:hypothetical protein